MSQPCLVFTLIVYVICCRYAVGRLDGTLRNVVFAVLNVVCVYFVLFYGDNKNYLPRFAAYLGLAGLQYTALRLFSDRKGWTPWLAFVTPILFLIMLRYVPLSFYQAVGGKLGVVCRGIPNFVGLSYFAFRSSYMVLEVRNGVVKKPGFWEYLGFCFFVPTMSVGPINPYSNHQRVFRSGSLQPIQPGRALFRIIVGLVKFLFLGNLCDRLGYASLLLDDHYHHWIDLPVAIFCYYLFLYCNFSGFCDVAIGMAGLIGVPVAENFENPFAARNVKDFWNRWHITLSQYMRDVVFSPLSKFSVRMAGPANANHAIAFTIVVVFLLVGIWHGVGWNFAAYGAAHALGVVGNHYYTIGLKRWLGRDGFKAYNANRWIHGGAVALTFCYCAATLFLFANSFDQMKDILAHMR